MGERGGGATVAGSDRGFTGVRVARVQGHYLFSSGARGPQAASAGEVGSEGQDGGTERAQRREWRSSSAIGRRGRCRPLLSPSLTDQVEATEAEGSREASMARE